MRLMYFHYMKKKIWIIINKYLYLQCFKVFTKNLLISNTKSVEALMHYALLFKKEARNNFSSSMLHQYSNPKHEENGSEMFRNKTSLRILRAQRKFF